MDCQYVQPDSVADGLLDDFTGKLDVACLYSGKTKGK